jgi:hypothetical protein
MDRLIALADADPVPANAITEDWLAVVEGRRPWRRRGAPRAETFWRERAHMVRRGNTDWPSLQDPAASRGRAWRRQSDQPAGRPVARRQPLRLALGALVMPDGRILSRSQGGTLRLWDGASGAPGPVLAGHTGRVLGALTTPDGRMLSWSDDATLRLWDGASGVPGPVLAGHTHEVKGARVMPDGRILSWSKDGTLRVWDGVSGAPGPVLAGAGRVEGALVMADGCICRGPRGGCPGTGRCAFGKGASGTPGPVLAGHTGRVEGALVMPDGRILSWSEDKTLRLWDGASGASGPVLAGIPAGSRVRW